jgi:hypothetical protein
MRVGRIARGVEPLCATPPSRGLPTTAAAFSEPHPISGMAHKERAAGAQMHMFRNNGMATVGQDSIAPLMPSHALSCPLMPDPAGVAPPCVGLAGKRRLRRGARRAAWRVIMVAAVDQAPRL